MSSNSATSFRNELLGAKPLIGTFCKTPSHIVADVLGLTPLDCVCLDAEHAPFDRLSLDAMVSSMRASNMASIVRVPTAAPEHVLNALDCGATGIMAPHIRSVSEARALASAAQYGGVGGLEGRGYAGSSRAAGYTTRAMPEHLKRSAEQTVTIAQIEDLEALDAIDDIAQVEGIDCLFIGRIDLAVAMKAAPGDQKVLNAVSRICEAGKKADRRIGMFVADMNEIPGWIAKGATLFILKSEHSFILDGANALKATFDSKVGR